MLRRMLKVDALIEHIALAELRMLWAVDPAAATRKAKRMCRSPEDFIRGALPLVVPWLTAEIGADGPWVWSVGDAHQGNFATLAVGRMDRDGIVPVTYGLADVDDEGPAPWSWDLLRLLSSVAVMLPDLKRMQFNELCLLTLHSYRECLQRFAEGDELAARIDANGLPETLKQLLQTGSGEAQHKRYMASMVKGAGAAARLQRTADIVDDEPCLHALRAAWGDQHGLPEHTVLDAARRLNPGGLSSLGRRRWWLLLRETSPVPRLRLLELKERSPSNLSRVIPVSPFAPWMRANHPQPVSSTMGGDPFQRVLRLATGEYLSRTRCHTRAVLDLSTLDGGDRRRLGHLYGQLLATFHWQGLTQLTPDVGPRCAAIASATATWDDLLPKHATELADHLTALATSFSKRIAPLLKVRKDQPDSIVLD